MPEWSNANRAAATPIRDTVPLPGARSPPGTRPPVGRSRAHATTRLPTIGREGELGPTANWTPASEPGRPCSGGNCPPHPCLPEPRGSGGRYTEKGRRPSPPGPSSPLVPGPREPQRSPFHNPATRNEGRRRGWTDREADPALGPGRAPKRGHAPAPKRAIPQLSSRWRAIAPRPGAPGPSPAPHGPFSLFTSPRTARRGRKVGARRERTTGRGEGRPFALACPLPDESRGRSGGG